MIMMVIGFPDLENKGLDINFTELELSVTEVCGNRDFSVLAALN